MKDKEKADKRFTASGEEIKVTFIPQCCSCLKNSNLLSCQAFNIKPEDIRKNKRKCPEYKNI